MTIPKDNLVMERLPHLESNILAVETPEQGKQIIQHDNIMLIVKELKNISKELNNINKNLRRN